MASSNKTTYLGLNRWLGTDKPKREDFNADNQKIDTKVQQLFTTISGQGDAIGGHDTAISGLTDQVAALEGVSQGQSAAIGRLDTSMEAAGSAITALEGEASSQQTALQSHTNSAAVHITEAERIKWNAMPEPQCYTYTGNAAMSRRIALGAKPKCGFVFAVGYPPTSLNATSGLHEINTVFFSGEGCGSGIALNSDGFTIYHDGVSGGDGTALKLNRSGTAYVCIYWK